MSVITINTYNLHITIGVNKRLRSEISNFFDELAKIISELIPKGAESIVLPWEIIFEFSPPNKYSFSLNERVLLSDSNKEHLIEFLELIRDGWLSQLAVCIDEENKCIYQSIMEDLNPHHSDLDLED